MSEFACVHNARSFVAEDFTVDTAEIKAFLEEVATFLEAEPLSDIEGQEQARALIARSRSLAASLTPTQEKIPFDEIVAAYHLFLPMLPKVLRMTDTRKRQLRARWNEDKARQNTEWWRDLFRRTAKSDFLTGRSGKSDFSWSCGLDFLLQPKSLTKLLEGSYDNKPGRQQTTDLVTLAMHNSRSTRGAV